MKSKKALIVTDIQNDFCDGGALQVRGADIILHRVNDAIRSIKSAGGRIIATRDYHPANHSSFITRGGIWPVHCVAGTFGAQFKDGLDTESFDIIISKAESAEVEEYSSFCNPELDRYLEREKIGHVYVCGLATEYCVKQTALDALKRGYRVTVLSDAVKGVDVNEGDCHRAVNEMKSLGVHFSKTSLL